MHIYIFKLVIIFFLMCRLTNPFNIYVLKLIQDKYYIGKTQHNVLIRYNKHIQGQGSQWTKLYKPVGIVEQFETSDKFAEDTWTKKYMDFHGIDNVRGGSYANIVLTEWQTKALETELRTCNNLCFKCGKSGHFSSQCRRFFSN